MKCLQHEQDKKQFLTLHEQVGLWCTVCFSV